jgi:hypothetical protein
MDNLEDWYKEVLENDDTTSQELEAFARLADIDPEFTDMLAMDYCELGTLLVGHENTTPAIMTYVLEVVSQDWKKAGYVMQSIADNAKATAEILNTLFLHGDRYVREMVVVHPNVTEALLVRAAKDKKESVRSQLVFDHARVPDEALRYLAENDKEDYIRFSAQKVLKDRKTSR